METLFSDLRQSVRVLVKSPGFTIVALAALTIGIGANAAIFSVVEKVLLQPLPYPEPDRMVQLGRKYTNGEGYSNSIPKYMTWRNNSVFSSMALFDQQGPGLNLSSGDHPEQVKGSHVSADYFKVFGASPMLGRTFTQAEDLPNGPKAAIVSESLWRAHFGHDPNILSRTIMLNGEAYPIVGVIPSSFIARPESEIWIPLQADPNSTNQGHYLFAAARLKPGVTLGQAQGELRALGERFRRQYPKMMDKDETVAVTPMADFIVHDMRKALYVLIAAVSFVLLIACANVANLLLARASVRQRELAIRAALGASRWRVVRQLLTESVLLSVVGGVLGLLLGALGVRALLTLVPGDVPRISETGELSTSFAMLNWQIVLFTAGLCLLTGVLFGLFPALQISNPDLSSTLKEAGTRSSTARHQNLVRKILVAGEMAMALVLLTSAALLIRTFVGLTSSDSGIDPNHVTTMLTTLSGARYQTTAQTDLFIRQALERIQSVPGIESVSASIVLPVSNEIDLDVDIPGKAKKAGEDHNGDEQWRSISPNYFSVFHIPLQRGRVFNDHDTIHSAKVVIVNAAFAKKFFASENPIGHMLEIGKGLGPEFEEPGREIVGVVGDVRETGLAAD
jgi:putative ABC transport system permease protein